jgi:hypothetical protein
MTPTDRFWALLDESFLIDAVRSVDQGQRDLMGRWLNDPFWP